MRNGKTANIAATGVATRRKAFALATATMGCALLGMVGTAKAAVLYSDSFNRNGTLAGTPTDQGSGTWAEGGATPSYTTSTDNGGQALATATSRLDYVSIPYATIWKPDTTYALSATITVTSPSAGGFNLALGLGNGALVGFHNDAYEVSLDYAVSSSTGSHVVTWNGTTSNIGATNASIFGAADTFTITVTTPDALDTGTWTAAFTDSLGLIAANTGYNFTVSSANLAKYNSIYIANSSQTGTFQNFSFSTVSAVPEPASLGLLALGGLGLLARRRRTA